MRCSDSPDVCSDLDVETENPQILKNNLFPPLSQQLVLSWDPVELFAPAFLFCHNIVYWMVVVPGGLWSHNGKERGNLRNTDALWLSALLPHLQVSFFLFIIFVVYTMLPFNMRDAIIASVLTSSSHTIVLSVCLSATPGAKEHLVWQVGAPPPLHGTFPIPPGMGEAPHTCPRCDCWLVPGRRPRSALQHWLWVLLMGSQFPAPSVGGIGSHLAISNGENWKWQFHFADWLLKAVIMCYNLALLFLEWSNLYN